MARRDFYEFARLMAPRFYLPDRAYLADLCRQMQEWKESPEPVMIINAPPRHGKSRTAGLFTQWVFGRNPDEKIMTGSYNETLSTTFSKAVRGGISEAKADDAITVYSDIFPGVRIKYGDAAMNLWSLEGRHSSYLATSPSGTATGFGASLLIIDDLIKSAEEALNETTLEKHWLWFTDTMLSRLEEGGKILIIMTRWATGDLAGRALEYFKAQGLPARTLVLKAVQDDGTMLCPDILSAESYRMKAAAMSEEIASANYQQIPVDLKGCLYPTIKTYSQLPEHTEGIYCYIDTADDGSDYLCAIVWAVYKHEAYVLDILYTKDGMELTEPATARLLDLNKVNLARIESNNGGKGFARSVRRQLEDELHNYRCDIRWFHQSKNKIARILSNSTWVMQHVYFPEDWRYKWPEYYAAMTRYQKEGKNKHDDAPDATTGVAETMYMLGA